MKLLLLVLAVGTACAYKFDFYDDYFSEAFVNYHNSRSDVTWKVKCLKLIFQAKLKSET